MWTQAPMGARVTRGLGGQEPSSDSLSLPAGNPPIHSLGQAGAVCALHRTTREDRMGPGHERAAESRKPSRPGRVSTGARVPGGSEAEGVLSRGPWGCPQGHSWAPPAVRGRQGLEVALEPLKAENQSVILKFCSRERWVCGSSSQWAGLRDAHCSLQGAAPCASVSPHAHPQAQALSPHTCAHPQHR